MRKTDPIYDSEAMLRGYFIHPTEDSGWSKILGTSFMTPNDSPLQVGELTQMAGGRADPHRHMPLERKLFGMCEVLIVIEGRIAVDLYTEKLAVTRVEVPKDGIIVMIPSPGWHGVEYLEDSRVIEVKQGPFINDKVFPIIANGESSDGPVPKI